MSRPQEPPLLTVADFTGAVAPLVDFLKTKYQHNPLRISDVWDNPNSVTPDVLTDPDDQCRQYIDLVQEGGGVHGIALTGFTYVLEKMGISFMKMAGTSAGAINTMLLSCIYNKREAILLGRDPKDYYETRSEKLLEYLAKKRLTDLVDGPDKWSKLLRRLFSGDVDFNHLKVYQRWITRAVKACVLAIILLFLTAIISFIPGQHAMVIDQMAKWLALTGVVLLIISAGYLFYQYTHITGLRSSVKKNLGINPGKDFETWLEACMMENGIHTVQDLRDKLEKEEKVLAYSYKPVILETAPDYAASRSLFESASPADEMPSVLQNKIANPEFSMASIKRSYQEISKHDVYEVASSEPSHDDQLAFAKRTENFVSDKMHKEIVIVAADITNEIKVEFPGMHNMYWGDDMSISPARYVRASMSIPVFFFPFKVQYDALQAMTVASEWKKYLTVQKTFKDEHDVAWFVDGGLLSNFPLNVFYNPEMPLPSRPTIGIKLEYEDETRSNDIRTEGGLLKSLVSTMRFFYDRDFINKHNMYKKTVRSIDTGKVHWLNFSLSNEEQIELFFRGALAAAIFLGKLQKDSPELQVLKDHGKKLKTGSRTFSVFAKSEDFHSEDLLIPGITFDWERYKIDRIKDALSSNPDVLREHAMMQ